MATTDLSTQTDLSTPLPDKGKTERGMFPLFIIFSFADLCFQLWISIWLLNTLLDLISSTNLVREVRFVIPQ